jgi:hypothetical protein
MKKSKKNKPEKKDKTPAPGTLYGSPATTEQLEEPEPTALPVPDHTKLINGILQIADGVGLIAASIMTKQEIAQMARVLSAKRGRK